MSEPLAAVFDGVRAILTTPQRARRLVAECNDRHFMDTSAYKNLKHYIIIFMPIRFLLYESYIVQLLYVGHDGCSESAKQKQHENILMLVDPKHLCRMMGTYTNPVYYYVVSNH